MSNVFYLPVPRSRALEAAYALKDVEYLRELCHEVRLRTRRRVVERIAIGQRLDPELIPKLEALVRGLDQRS